MIMGCEMCGFDGGLVKANVEGVVLNVCSTCSEFGNVLEERTVSVVSSSRSVVEEVVVNSIGKLLRSWREGQGLTQKEVGSRVGEKESVVSKIESGFVPSIKLARKLERMIGVVLVGAEKVSKVKIESKSGSYTIGDFLDS